MKNRKLWAVYWLYETKAQDPRCDGYVGCTNNMARRLWQHHSRDRLPPFKVKILTRGTHAECLAYEKELRQQPIIGWNIHAGGYPTGKGGKGVPKSAEHRAKIRAAALERYKDPKERARTKRAVKKAFEHIDRTGSNNSMFGRTQSEETRQKISDKVAERGGHQGANNPNWKGID